MYEYAWTRRLKVPDEGQGNMVVEISAIIINKIIWLRAREDIYTLADIL